MASEPKLAAQPMPPQPKTAAFEAPSQNEIMLREVLQTVKRMEGSFGLMDSAVNVIQKDVHALFEWKGTIIQWQEAMDARSTNNSQRARAQSDHSLEADAKLAAQITWRAGVDAKLAEVPTKEDLAKTTAAQTTALLEELKKNPVVQKVLYAAGGAIAAYLASKGIHIL